MVREFTVEWQRYAAFEDGNHIRGEFRVTYDGAEASISAFMYPRTITAFAAVRGIDNDAVAGQIQLGARVLAEWGKRKIEAALKAGAQPPNTLRLEATQIEAQMILRDLGDSIDRAP